VRSVGSVSDDDLTGRARIRDAALARFPVDGFGRTTIRAVAADADVSPALVIHHFGSKEGLRRACDEHVIAIFRRLKNEALEDGNLGNPGFLGGAYSLAPAVNRYLAWTLAAGGDTADQLFDELLEEATKVMAIAEAAGIVQPSDHPNARNALLMAMQLGGLVLHRHLSRALGVDTLTTEGVMVVSTATIDIFTKGVFTSEAGRLTKEAIEAVAAELTRKEHDDD
jgi:TetR/AcrR family transcriptional regulator, regulator of cefoperazone and chloramphenicol sensitivity